MNIEHSYQLKATNQDIFDVHTDQLKECLWDNLGEPIFKITIPRGRPVPTEGEEEEPQEGSQDEDSDSEPEYEPEEA